MNYGLNSKLAFLQKLLIPQTKEQRECDLGVLNCNTCSLTAEHVDRVSGCLDSTVLLLLTVPLTITLLFKARATHWCVKS